MTAGPIERSVMLRWLRLPAPLGRQAIEIAAELRAGGQLDDSDALAAALDQLDGAA